MIQETISVKKTDLLSLVNKLEDKNKKEKTSKLSFFSKIFSLKRNFSDSEKDSIVINKIWRDCLKYEERKRMYLHEFEIPSEIYNTYLKKYFNN